MGADLHAEGVSNQAYLDDAVAFMAEYGAQPGIDVTALRDSEGLPGYIQDTLHRSKIHAEDAALLADALELATLRNDLPEHETRAALDAARWLRAWSDRRHAIEGIH